MSHPVDLFVVLLYLVATIGIGFRSLAKNRSTEDYFFGNRGLPGWAVGLSMVGTSISAVTFLAFPAAAYSLDWRLLVPNMMIPVGIVVAIYVCIPLYRSFKIASVYEYLENRFGPFIRFFAAVNFIIGQYLRLGIVLYLVAIPIGPLLGIDVLWVIIIAGVFVTVYSMFGGINAVVWTDVLQTIILMFGGAVCLVFLLAETPGSTWDIVKFAYEQDKFGLGEARWDISERTLFTMIVLGFVSWLQSYMCNQNVVQRYLAVSSDREARKATLISGIVGFLNWAFFFLLGTLLFVHYVRTGDPAVVDMASDQVFPHFILTVLPAGVSGIIISAAVAAAMSSLDSSMNVISLTLSKDIFQRFLTKHKSDKFHLKLARWTTLLSGLFMIGAAICFHFTPRESLLDTLIALGSLLVGSLLSIFLLGFFAPRVGNKAVVWSVIISLIARTYLLLNYFGWLPEAWQVEVHAYWIAIIVDGILLICALLFSLILPPDTKDLTGLVYSRRQLKERERLVTSPSATPMTD